MMAPCLLSFARIWRPVSPRQPDGLCYNAIASGWRIRSRDHPTLTPPGDISEGFRANPYVRISEVNPTQHSTATHVALLNIQKYWESYHTRCGVLPSRPCFQLFLHGWTNDVGLIANAYTTLVASISSLMV